MKIKLLLVSVFLVLVSCKDDNETQRQIEIVKFNKEKELVFASLNKNWNFQQQSLTPESQNIATDWNEWRLFTNELSQKPKGTIGAFQRKSKALVQKAEVLLKTIPEKINKPQFRSRLMAIVTKVKALNTFINLDQIPQKRVLTLVADLNIEVKAFQDQIEEVVRRSHIQLEEGEGEMIQQIGGKTPEPEKPKETLPQQEIKSFEEIK
jgi:uncharacterized lipoprotein